MPMKFDGGEGGHPLTPPGDRLMFIAEERALGATLRQRSQPYRCLDPFLDAAGRVG